MEDNVLEKQTHLKVATQLYASIVSTTTTSTTTTTTKTTSTTKKTTKTTKIPRSTLLYQKTKFVYIKIFQSYISISEHLCYMLNFHEKARYINLSEQIINKSRKKLLIYIEVIRIADSNER